uniref:Contraction-inhibiting peptide 2 n=1 Tax=Mytilus edulis TaxID=6550 RepID=CIP2_MYTED|nr:RecName: Full=Contraction-inhibiting peptide 2; AltName: Full=MIP II [Mytilus edulis]
GAPMFV